jgi:hypothetical protein
MKILIASDIHGSAHYCEKLLKAFEREQADRLLLLGIFYTTAQEMLCPRTITPWRLQSS